MYQAQTPKKQVDYTDFDKENTMINLRRGLKLSLIGIAIALIFLIGFLINAFLMDFNISKQSTYLIIAYLFLLIALVLIIASYSIIKKYFRLTCRILRVLSFLPYAIILFWSVFITFINSSPSNIVISYMIGLLIFGTIPLFKPVVSITTIALSFLTYILVPIIFSSFTTLENDYLNPTVFALFAILASLFLYFQKEKDYYERKNIMEENKELYNLNSKLQKKSITDSLTSYYNRHFLESLSEKCNYNIKNNIPVGVLMIDIDNFKDFNDYYNHIEGDRALIKISETIKEVIAPYTDNIFRYGGEEFLVVFFNLSEAEIREIAEDARQAVYNLGIKNPGLRPGANVTISIGGTVTKEHDDRTFEKLIVDADTALYNVKSIGKNNSLFI